MPRAVGAQALSRTIDSLRRSIPWYHSPCAAICEYVTVARRMRHTPGNRIIGF